MSEAIQAQPKGMSFVSVLELVTKTLGAMVSATLITIAVACVYIVWTYGYPRMWWTHHTYDARREMLKACKRLVTRMDTVFEGIQNGFSRFVRVKSPTLQLSLSRFQEAYNSLVNRDKDELCETFANHLIKTGIFKRRDSPLSLTLKHAAEASNDMLMFSELLELQNSEKFHASICAMADIRVCMQKIVPAIREVHTVKTKGMGLIETIDHHTRFEFVDYYTRVKKLFSVDSKQQAAAVEDRKGLLKQLDVAADDMMGSQSVPRPQPSKPSKKRWYDKIPGVKQVRQMTSLAKTIVDSIGVFLQVLMHISNTIAEHGFVAGLSMLTRAFVGLIMKVAVNVLGTLLETLIDAVYLYARPAVTTLWHTVVLVVMVAIRLSIAIADFAGGGWLRHMQYTHDVPDAWWQRAGFERGNRFVRYGPCWYPCARGYIPNFTGTYCRCEDDGMPRRSPASLLMRRYTLGSFREWGRHLPARTTETVKRFQALCVREYAKLFAEDQVGPQTRDLVECLAICCSTLFGRSQKLTDIARYAALSAVSAGGTASARVFRDKQLEDIVVDRVFVTPWWPRLLISSFLAFVVVLLIKHNAQLSSKK